MDTAEVVLTQQVTLEGLVELFTQFTQEVAHASSLVEVNIAAGIVWQTLLGIPG